MAPFSCAVKPRIGECLLQHSPIRFGHKKKSRSFNQLFARCHPDLNWRMKVLQTFALPLGYGTIIRNGAVDGARTRDLHLGKVAYYQLYYYRTSSMFYYFVFIRTIFSITYIYGIVNCFF